MSKSSHTNETLYKIAVAKKTVEHPYYGQGSSFGYVVKGGGYETWDQGPLLRLFYDTPYIFSIDTLGHPLIFTTSRVGAMKINNTLTTDPPTEYGDLHVFFPSIEFRTMSDFYYQCNLHPYMGGKVHLSRQGSPTPIRNERTSTYSIEKRLDFLNKKKGSYW